MESWDRNCFGAFATEVTTATQQMSGLVDETGGCERLSRVSSVTGAGDQSLCNKSALSPPRGNTYPFLYNL